MIRVVVYLAIVGVLAFGTAWFADRPGDVAIAWQGRRIETSVMVAMIAVATVAVLTAMLWSIIRAVLRSPDLLWRYLRARRGVRGYLALSQGLVAVGSGDVAAARKFMDEARRIAPDEPLTLLLTAQTAQLAGDRETAARMFAQMAGRDDTKLLGLHGLFIEARRRNDPAAALGYAEEASRHSGVPDWAGQAVLEFRCVAGDWTGALERLERNHKGGLVGKSAYRRQRAVLQTARAFALEDGDRDRGKALALEAVKLAPDLVPAAALAGRMLGEDGELRKAARIIEAAWKANPHPDLADAYAHLRPGDSARERLARIEALAAKSPGDIEAALAVARAALDAQEFVVARAALAPLVPVPTRRVAALMAELEEREHGDEGRAREWMTRALHARRDPAWTADGFVSDRWLPVSPITGRLDAFAWRDPLAGSDHVGTVIEVEDRPVLDEPRTPAAAEVDIPSGRTGGAPDGGFPPTEPPVRRARSVSAVQLAPAVIPLVHAPDDPGPDPEAQVEPEPEPTAAPSDGWSRIRALFKP
jgi:HemY protein